MSPDRFSNTTAVALRVMVQTVVFSTLLAVIKILSGLIGHSYALIADGIESMLDVVSSLVVWGGLRVAAVPADGDHPYGHGKAESLSAIAVALFLLGAGVALAVQSVREILTPHHAPAPFTLGVLLLVVLAKEFLFRRVNRASRATASTALQVDAWHQRSDAFTSGAAFIGISVALIGGEGYESADDWAALVACGIIAFQGVRLARVAVAEVMDAAAPEPLLRSIRELARTTAGVADVEKCFARKSGPGWLVDIHVEVDGSLSVAEGHSIGHRVQRALCESNLRILGVLVHVEPSRAEDP